MTSPQPPPPHHDPTPQLDSNQVTLIEHITTLVSTLDRRFDSLHQDLKDSITDRFTDTHRRMADADRRYREGAIAVEAQLAERDLRYQQRFDAQSTALRLAMAAQLEVFREADRRYQERFEAQNEALRAALTAQQTSTSAALANAREAIQTTLLDEMNSRAKSSLSEMDLRYEQRYEAQTKAVDAAFAAQQTATSTALASAERAVLAALLAAKDAVGKAEIATEKRFEQMAMSQHQTVEQIATAMPRTECGARMTGLSADYVQRIEGQRAAMEAAMDAADKAVSKAEVANEKRFESVNEFRQQLGDQTKAFVTRLEHDQLRDSIHERIRDLTTRADREAGKDSGQDLDKRFREMTAQTADLTARIVNGEGRSSGLNAGWIYLLGAIAALGTIVSLYLALK